MYLLPYLAVVAASWIAYGLAWHSPLVATTAWDGQHYLAIAAHGYPAHLDTTYSNLAFFPGLPMAVAGLHLLALPIDLAGFVVSVAAGAAFCWAGGVIVERRSGPRAGLRSSMLLAVLPGAFLYGISYADPLAVALMALCLLALDSRHFARAGLCGALACLTSPLALPIVLAGLAAAATAWRERASLRPGVARLTASRRLYGAIAAAVAMPLGTVAFMGYLWLHTGMVNAWFAAEDHGWYQGFALTASIGRLSSSVPPSAIPATEIACAYLAAAGLFAMVRARAPLTWWAIAVPVVSVGLFARGSWLDPRILFDAFPLALAAASVVKGRWFAVMLVCSCVAMQLCLIAYTVMWGNIVAQP